MSERRITISGCHLFRCESNEWTVSGTAPKGGYVRIKLGQLDIDALRCAHRLIGTRIGELVAEHLKELDRVRDELARQWNVVNSTLKREEPKP